MVNVSQSITVDPLSEEATYARKMRWDGCCCMAFTYTFLAWAMPRTNECQQDPSACSKNKEQGIPGGKDGVDIISRFKGKHD